MARMDDSKGQNDHNQMGTHGEDTIESEPR